MTDLSDYHALIAAKKVAFEPVGLAKVPELNSAMNPHQAHCTDFALRTGRGALFLDTGLGKTFCALEWGRVVVEHTNRPVRRFIGTELKDTYYHTAVKNLEDAALQAARANPLGVEVAA